MPTLVCACTGVGDSPSGLPNDQTWSNLNGLQAFGGAAAFMRPFYVLLPALTNYASQGQTVFCSFNVAALPASSTVNAIRFFVRRMRTATIWPGSGVQDLFVRIALSGMVVGPDRASASAWPGAYAYQTYSFAPGSEGVPTLTGGWLSGMGLSMRFDAKGTGGPFGPPDDVDPLPIAYVDHVYAEVDYTEVSPFAVASPLVRLPQPGAHRL